MTTTSIRIWVDTTSEGRDRARWIVSRDEIGEDGGAEVSFTLGVFESHEDARRHAERAATRGLPVHDESEDA